MKYHFSLIKTRGFRSPLRVFIGGESRGTMASIRESGYWAYVQ
jgi:hypothetical protein